MSECSFITKTVSLSHFTQSYLTKNELEENELSSDSICGGILSNTKYAWYANGPRFEVIDLKKGRTIAGWCFGSVVRDSSTRVVCVAEIPTLARDSPVLAIGLEYVLTGGTICIFDVLSSKVLRAIQIRDKISSLHVIDGGKSLLPLYGPLRSFDGVIGVGCIGGDVLIVDLCQHSIEEEVDRDEIDACQVVVLTGKDVPNLELHKQRLQPGVHLAIHLNSSNKEIPNRRNRPDIAVTALHYCPQLGSLLIGYSFGSWEIWELCGMTLVYISPTYDKNVPVSDFAIQEPADDPKPVCYIWVVYSYKEGYSSYPLAVLYSINYGIKEFHDGYGVLYQDFDVCVLRYQMELKSLSHNTNTRPTSREANCLRLTSYNKPNSSKSSPLETQEDVSSVCYLAWNVQGARGVETYVSLFDLNQWYKAQMPSSNDEESGNYLSVICVTDLIENENFLLDVAIEENSLKQFLGVQKPEEHYFPTALSFDICCCDEKIVNFIHHQGRQRSLLNNLEKADSVIFLKPLEICQAALQLGLAPLFFDASINAITSQREFLLSLALEQQMTGWLCKNANTWSNGRFKSSGCTLEFFLEWAWNRAVILKTNADSLSTPLFDYSESTIDANNQRILNFCVNQLGNILVIYQYALKKLDEFILHKDIVQQQCDSLQMVVIHLETLQWLVNTGLLPENAKSYLYPIDSLLPYYSKRRSELQDTYHQRFSSNENLLFIDNLMKNEFSNMILQEYWKEDDGDGLYPPPSMQSLLRTYLTDNVNLETKHSVIIYAFLDLAMGLERDKHTFAITQLIKFPIIFRLSASIIKLTQAFWHLDHGDFGPALERLLDPLISSSDLKVWHHRTVLNAFLIQGQHNLALTYYQIRKPYLSDDDDLLKVLSLFAGNNMIHEAMDFQRKHVTVNNQVRILTHLYRECNSIKQLKKILHYALTKTEEQILMTYLRDISHPHQEELEIMYYLQRYRYMDIFEMSKDQTSTVPSGLSGQKALPFRETFAKTLSGFFPKVATDLFQTCKNQKVMLGNKVISRPRPMSVFVHNAEEQAKYKSTLIQIGIVKAQETWNKAMVEQSPCETNLTAENFPFMRTPVTPSSTTRKRPSILCPKIIKVSEGPEVDTGESPSKKQKLSPRQSVGTPLPIKPLNDSSLNISLPKVTKLDTPIIKRKTRKLSEQTLQRDVASPACTPQSILKVRNLISSHSLLQEDIMSASLKTTTSTSGLGLTRRKSLPRLSVHFENNSQVPSLTQDLEQTSHILNLSSILPSNEASIEKIQHSSDSKETSEEVYYSPESSLEEVSEKEISGMNKSKETVSKQSFVREERKSVSPVKDGQQIKGRSSYKDKIPDIIIEDSTPMSKATPAMLTKSPVISSPHRASKPKGRKSLSRLVLENNALSTLSPTIRRSAKLSLTSQSPKPLSRILGGNDTANASSKSMDESEMSVKKYSLEKEETREANQESHTEETSVIKSTSEKEETTSVMVHSTPNRQRLLRRRSLGHKMNDSTNTQPSDGSIRKSLTTDTTDESIISTDISSLNSSRFHLPDSLFETDCSSVHDEEVKVENSHIGKCEKGKDAQELASSTSTEIDTPLKIHTNPNLAPTDHQSVNQENISKREVTDVNNVTDLKMESAIKVTTPELMSPYPWSSYTESLQKSRSMLSFPESLFESYVSDFSAANNVNLDDVYVIEKSDQQYTKVEAKTENVSLKNSTVKLDAVEEDYDKINEVNLQNVQEKSTDETVESSKEIFEECLNIDDKADLQENVKSNIKETVGEIVSLNEFEMNIEYSDMCLYISEAEEVTVNRSEKAQSEVLQESDVKLRPEKPYCLASITPEQSNVMEQGFILSTDNIIEISDSSDKSTSSEKVSKDMSELNNAMIETVESDDISDKSTDGSYSPESLSNHSSEEQQSEDEEKKRPELCRSDSEEIERKEAAEIDEHEETEELALVLQYVERKEDADDNDKETERAELTVQVNLEEYTEEKLAVKDVAIQVSLLSVEIEEGIDTEQESFLNPITNEGMECIIDLPAEENESLQILKDDSFISTSVGLYEDIGIIEETGNEIPESILEEHLVYEEEVTIKPSTSFELPEVNNKNGKEDEIQQPCKDTDVKNNETVDQNIKEEMVSEQLPEIKLENSVTRSSELQQGDRKVLQSAADDVKSEASFKVVEEVEKKVATRTLRSLSADPETPRRKSRRLSGAGPLEDNSEVLPSPSLKTRRSSTKIANDDSVTPKKSTAGQRRIKRSVSTSDCVIDDLQPEVKVPGKRLRRTTSTTALPSISEENDKQPKNTRRNTRTKLLAQEETTEDNLELNESVNINEKRALKKMEKSNVISKDEDAKTKRAKKTISQETENKKQNIDLDENDEQEMVKSKQKREKSTREKKNSDGHITHKVEHVEENEKSARKVKKVAQEEDKEECFENEEEKEAAVDYPSSRRITRTQKHILTKVQSVQPKTAEELHIETTPPKAEHSSSKMMTRSRSTDSVSSVSSSIPPDAGKSTQSGLRRKPSEESLTTTSRSLSKSPSGPGKRLRSASQKSDAVSEAGSESPTPSLRRSTRSRSKTPDLPEKTTRTLRKGPLQQIPEEPEKAGDEPKNKKGRTRKASAT